MDYSITNVLLAFLLFQFKVYADFHFCHFGPSKFSFVSECPGGVFFNVPVETNCTYFSKSSAVGDGRLTVTGDVCDSSTMEEMDVSAASSTHSFSTPKIQEIVFSGDAAEPTPGAPEGTTPSCVSECFSAWKPPQQQGGGDSEVDNNEEPEYVYPTLTPEQNATQKRITEQLFLNLMLNDGTSDNAGSDLRVGKLLEATFLVMSTYCTEPYISQSFVKMTLDAFFAFASNSNKSVKDVGIREFDELMDILAQCRYYDAWDSFQIIGDQCTEIPTILGAVAVSMNGSERRVMVKAAPNLERFDPFIEAAWQAISFVNAQCFRYETPQFNLHHVYMVAMEALFLDDMLLRWPNPPTLPDPEFWNNLMGSPSFKIEVQNVNTCAKLAYLMNPYRIRLERPYKKGNGTVSAAVGSEGWSKPEDEYWKQYETNGGFRTIVQTMGGTCYQSELEREAAKDTAAGKCPNSVRK